MIEVVYEKLFVALGQKYGKPANNRDEIIALFNHLAVQGEASQFQKEEIERLKAEVNKLQDLYDKADRNLGLLTGLILDAIKCKTKLSRVAVNIIKGHLERLDIKVATKSRGYDLKFAERSLH